MPKSVYDGRNRFTFSGPLAVSWVICGLGVCVIAAIHSATRKGVDEADYYMWGQDAGVLLGISILLLSLPWAPQLRSLPEKCIYGRHRLLLSLAVACGLFCWAGHRIVFDNFALSRDEDLALFHASSLATGHLIEPIPIAWREFARALQPRFMIEAPANSIWVTSYLPVNAGLQAIGVALGDASFISPLLAVVTLVATYAVALKLWPGRPCWALVSIALLATSSQFLITAMTPYSMNAHLALNMLWLWFHLRGGKLGHGGAVFVGFFACGLHQLVFHPLFVAPFMLELLAARRWRLSLFYTLSYAAICLFWSSYFSILINSAGVPTLAVAPQAASIWRQAADLITAFDVGGLGIMAKNIARFMTWQNPLTVPLIAVFTFTILKSQGAIRALLVGLIISTIAMLILLPYQGAGWGYRYLHGNLGAACLLATWSLSHLWERSDDSGRLRMMSNFLMVSAVALFVLLPLRMWQAHDFVRPYVAASRFIGSLPVDVVLIDDTRVWQGIRLVRNNPGVTNTPVRMHFTDLTRVQIKDLCTDHSVALFTPTDAARFGLWAVLPSRQEQSAKEATDRADLLALGCHGAPD